MGRWLGVLSLLCALAHADDLDRVRQRVAEVELKIEQLEAEIELFRAQSRLVIQRTQPVYTNRFYFKGGFTILFPRGHTFPTAMTGYGLGAFAGLGRYIGKHNVLE